MFYDKYNDVNNIDISNTKPVTYDEEVKAKQIKDKQNHDYYKKLEQITHQNFTKFQKSMKNNQSTQSYNPYMTSYYPYIYSSYINTIAAKTEAAQAKTEASEAKTEAAQAKTEAIEAKAIATEAIKNSKAAMEQAIKNTSRIDPNNEEEMNKLIEALTKAFGEIGAALDDGNPVQNGGQNKKSVNKLKTILNNYLIQPNISFKKAIKLTHQKLLELFKQSKKIDQKKHLKNTYYLYTKIYSQFKQLHPELTSDQIHKLITHFIIKIKRWLIK